MMLSDGEIVAMYQEKTISAIAEELSISRRRVVMALRSNGVQIIHGGRRERTTAQHIGKGSTLTAADHDLIVEEGRAGGTLREIVTRVRERGLHVSDTAVRRHLRIAGIAPTPGEFGHVAKLKSKPTAPVQHSPRVAAWNATCRSCKRRISVADAMVSVLARRMASMGHLTPRQEASLAEARQNLIKAKDISRACSDCHPKAVTE